MNDRACLVGADDSDDGIEDLAVDRGHAEADVGGLDRPKDGPVGFAVGVGVDADGAFDAAEQFLAVVYSRHVLRCIHLIHVEVARPTTGQVRSE